MKKKQIIFGGLGLAVIITGAVVGRNLLGTKFSDENKATTETSVRFVSSTITADGTVTAANQAKLNFQTSGKLVRLPFKEGDKVTAGQTIAQLDNYSLQRQFTAALNNYRSSRDSFDQTKQNSDNGALKPQLTTGYSNATYGSTSAVDEAIKRIVDQNQASLDNSVINVELANYALQLSRLTSPLNGIVTHQDVTVAGVNVTPATSFVVADPNSIVFRANVLASNIYYIGEGSSVSLAIDGVQNKIEGKVIKIYPSKVTLPNGQAVYQVDIASDQLKQSAKLDQTGRAIISTNSENVALVPAWTVIGGDFIWTDNDGVPELKKVTAGKIHDNEIEIVSGLSENDKVITNPEYIASLKSQVFGKIRIDHSLIKAPVIIVAPSLTGKVQEINVKEGQTIQNGDTLAIVGSETLRSDADGLIISANDITGSTVSPSTQLIQMIKPVNMRVTGTIDENKGLNKISVGQVVSFTVDALKGNTYWGYIDEIAPSANTPAFSFSSSSERPTQQFTVYARFDSTAYPMIKNGMSAKMVVYTKTH